MRCEGDEEDVAPAPRLALATANTHDMPTLAGWWQGRDIKLSFERIEGYKAVDKHIAAEGEVLNVLRWQTPAGDARSDTYTARVVKRPTVREYRIDYVYPAIYRAPGTFGSSFAAVGGQLRTYSVP